MSTYLLLRNNKESGPFTTEQLVANGLKPYDLVWLQGKSAAWRYPSEIPELQPYAPAVEEQPFDRFYKKTEEDQVVPAAEPVKNEIPKKAAIQEETIAPSSPWEPKAVVETAKPAARKSVFVTLPASAQKTTVQKAAAPVPQAVTPKPEPIIDEPVVAEIKYSQPLDEIKEMYVKTLQDRRSRNARKSVLLSNVKKAAVIVGILFAGALVGYAINSSGSDGKKVIANAAPLENINPVVTPEEDTAVATDDAQGDQSATTVVVPMIDASRNPVVQRLVTSSNGLFKRDDSPTEVRVTREALQSAARDVPVENTPVKPQPVVVNESTGERSRRVRTEDVQDPSPALPARRVQRNAWDELVSVSANDYKRVAFGGIRNLQLTVTNSSKYPIENVTVQLEYIKPSEETLRTENVHFRSIGANETSTIRIPDTNRGIRVNYRIVSVSSREMAESLANKD